MELIFLRNYMFDFVLQRLCQIFYTFGGELKLKVVHFVIWIRILFVRSFQIVLISTSTGDRKLFFSPSLPAFFNNQISLNSPLIVDEFWIGKALFFFIALEIW